MLHIHPLLGPAPVSLEQVDEATGGHGSGGGSDARGVAETLGRAEGSGELQSPSRGHVVTDIPR
eukprot:6239515-Alexandrium_andersonii.AAC.1